ncbi:MAG: UvrD-helicase domain-containing protein, partial [Pirellulaceae bacterium]|nr:UvrD-helicase domain-containing protein [Pirellulaceae bacterium]
MPYQPDDQHERDKIASDLDRNLLVEAAAGTGKTTCLISRMVSLLRRDKCSIGTLAAVTFTRKAAAELRSRFQLALERAVECSAGDERDRLNDALAHIERCFVGTIHSFCARLLRERPVEAGVDVGFVELDEEFDKQLRRHAWSEHVAALIAGDDPLLPELEQLGLRINATTRRSNSIVSDLDELGLEPAELGPAFIQFAEYPDVDDWPSDAPSLPDLEPARVQLIEYIDHMRSLELPADPGNDELMPKYKLLGRISRQVDLDQPAQLMELLEYFEGSFKIVQKNWPGAKEQALAEKARWLEFADNVAKPLLLTWRQIRYEAVIRILRPAREVYDRLRRERNGLNFQDLLMRSADLLRANAAVRNYFSKRFTHLLVDEFQDTDPIQAEVMLLLTASDCAENNWANCRPRPGSLFVVGDPKQSIYRFRRADILTYAKVRSIIESAGGAVVPLAANFRSRRPVVDWVNSTFSNIFPADNTDHSPADRPLAHGPELQAGDDRARIEKLIAPGSLRTYDAVAEHEADTIARTICQMVRERWLVERSQRELDHGVPAYAQPGDFLLIARAKTRLTIYARKLQQYGVPSLVTGGSLLNQVPELELLQVCVAAADRTDDPIALVAALRSELFGVADTTLYEFRRRGGRFSLYAPMPDGLPDDDAQQLAAAFEQLQTYARWLRRIPASAAVERIAGDLGLVARACAAKQGQANAGSLLKAIELLRRADGPLTIGDLTAAIERLVSQDEKHDGISVRPPATSPARVMNLHQCKGLESPFVFLIDPSRRKSTFDIDMHIDRSTERARGYLAVYGPRRRKYGRRPLLAQPANWDEFAEREQRFLDAEESRLLYVATTRAAERLVVSQRSGDANEKTNPWKELAGDLETVAEMAEPDDVPAAGPAPPVVVDPETWGRAANEIEDRWNRSAAASYNVRAIKATALSDGPKPRGSERGGAEWGEVMHSLLEAAMKNPAANLPALAAASLETVDLPLTLTDVAVDTVRRVLQSEIWRRACRSPRCFTEVPLALPVAVADEPVGAPTIARGVIDLVFREDSGWIIVDYKSERVDARQIPDLVSFYQPQVDAYADAWRTIV